MGIVVDEDKAMRSPCKCYPLDEVYEAKEEGYKYQAKPEDVLCFSEGVIGALSDNQDIEFCRGLNRAILYPRSKAFSKRLRKFKQMGKIMDICLEEEVKDFPGCVVREAKKLR